DDGYRQGGEPLDPEDMTNRLSEQPAAAAHVSRAKTLGTMGIILAAAGGALVGWPAGEALAGGDDPPWGLAAAGGGAVLVSIPFVLWSASSLSSAVEAHNAALGSPEPPPEALRR